MEEEAAAPKEQSSWSTPEEGRVPGEEGRGLPGGVAGLNSPDRPENAPGCAQNQPLWVESRGHLAVTTASQCLSKLLCENHCQSLESSRNLRAPDTLR